MTNHALNVFLALAATCAFMLFAIGIGALIELVRVDPDLFFAAVIFVLVWVGFYHAITTLKLGGKS